MKKISYLLLFVVTLSILLFGCQTTPTGKAVIDLPSDTIAYYSFDSNFNDESGNGHHAVSYGVLTTSGKFNQSAQISQGTYLTIPDDPSLDFSSSQGFTISMWVKAGSDLYSGSFSEKQESAAMPMPS